MRVAGLDRALDDAVVATIVYADLFDFPLEPAEAWRDLIGLAASPNDVGAAIDRLLAAGMLILDGTYLVLAGRGELSEIRRARRDRAARLWPIAHRLGGLLAALPYVRLIAVTGSLAAENPDADADLDFLIVTAPERLWLVRAMAIALVRLARSTGARLCPNYLLTTRALALDHHDLFTAHELLQAVPLAGGATYRQLLERNRWAARCLPNRFQRAKDASGVPTRSTLLKRIGEWALAGAAGDRLEGWEASRKQSRLGIGGGTGRFSADVCEGHYGQHREKILHAFQARCERLGIELEMRGPGTPRAGLLQR